AAGFDHEAVRSRFRIAVPDDPACGLRGLRFAVLLRRETVYALEPFAASGKGFKGGAGSGWRLRRQITASESPALAEAPRQCSPSRSRVRSFPETPIAPSRAAVVRRRPSASASRLRAEFVRARLQAPATPWRQPPGPFAFG